VPRPRRRRVERSLPTFVPSARTIGLSVGAGRLAIGAIFLAAPVASVRLLGLDTATARRTTWLARMTAARDGALGAGTLVSCAREDGAVAWLLAGSVSDAVDAAVLVAALREGKVRGWAAQAATAGAIAGALAGAAATLDVVRHR